MVAVLLYAECNSDYSANTDIFIDMLYLLWAHLSHNERRTADHILFTCDALSAKREHLWTNFLLMCPTQLAREIETMPITIRTNFMLNAMNNSYVSEWMDCYTALAEFICGLWCQYHTTWWWTLYYKDLYPVFVYMYIIMLYCYHQIICSYM